MSNAKRRPRSGGAERAGPRAGKKPRAPVTRRSARRDAKPSTTGLHSIAVGLDVLAKLLLGAIGIGGILVGGAGTLFGVLFLIAAVAGLTLSVLSLRYLRGVLIARLALGGALLLAYLITLVGSLQPMFIAHLVIECLVIAACVQALWILKQRQARAAELDE